MPNRLGSRGQVCVCFSLSATAPPAASPRRGVTMAVCRALSRGNAPTHKKARARAKDSKENVTIVEKKQAIVHESARKANEEESQQEKEAVANGPGEK